MLLTYVPIWGESLTGTSSIRLARLTEYLSSRFNQLDVWECGMVRPRSDETSVLTPIVLRKRRLLTGTDCAGAAGTHISAVGRYVKVSNIRGCTMKEIMRHTVASISSGSSSVTFRERRVSRIICNHLRMRTSGAGGKLR